MLILPYVTNASFKAYPTFLEVANLRSGDPILADQDAELYNILLKASAMADRYVELGVSSGNAATGTLTAHSRTENARVRTRYDGRISYHPDHSPVTAMTALSTGYSPNSLNPVTDLSNFWVEDGKQIVGYPGGVTSPGFGALQFGSVVAAGDLYAQWTYTSGFSNTLLAADVAQGATSVTVQDATGLAAGQVLRIWDPGHEEAVTIAGTYTTGSTTVPLTGGLKNAHTGTATVPVGISAVPADLHLAVIFYAAALLQRPDSESEDVFPSARVKSNARVGGSTDGSGFVTEAERLLEPYRRVR
ncbi:hypothetical protein [Amycolatopsis benzoatilytica]|uniref:hypothetical protein n=1 Tax=Amycolatopsis benzoatilytica TaxID=346045 RepID=UPI00036DE3C2|nr:hypothetical protein [Amycolatopsis benzoatilytica]